MKQGFVKSSPRFFRLIARSGLLFAAALLLAATIIRAPLQEAANPALTPNPVKSAWFLLWIQELVSYSRYMIYPVMALGSLFLLLPWLPDSGRPYHAAWFPRQQRGVNLLAVGGFVAIVALTVIALYFRGTNWSLSLHP
jgi:hypothetical protein